MIIRKCIDSFFMLFWFIWCIIMSCVPQGPLCPVGPGPGGPGPAGPMGPYNPNPYNPGPPGAPGPPQWVAATRIVFLILSGWRSRLIFDNKQFISFSVVVLQVLTSTLLRAGATPTSSGSPRQPMTPVSHLWILCLSWFSVITIHHSVCAHLSMLGLF